MVRAEAPSTPPNARPKLLVSALSVPAPRSSSFSPPPRKNTVGEKVRRKLAASLRGKASPPRPPSPSPPAGADAGTDAGTGAGTGTGGGGPGAAAGRGDDGAEGEAAAAFGGALSDVSTVDLPADLAAPLQVDWHMIFRPPGENLGVAAARAEARERAGGQAGGLDIPLVLTGAMEMLGTALVVLPEGDAEGARHCVG